MKSVFNVVKLSQYQDYLDGEIPFQVITSRAAELHLELKHKKIIAVAKINDGSD